MLIIGEKIQILNPTVFSAVEKRDTNLIADLAQQQIEAGAHGLDINLGPGRQAGMLLPDIVTAICDRVDAQLFFSADSPGFTEAMKACNGRATINASTAEPDELSRSMSAAKCFNADLVVLLTKRGCLPCTVDQWCLMAEEVIETAEKDKFPLEKLYIDPVLRTRYYPTAPGLGTMAMEIGPVCQALQLIKQLRESGIRTIVGLSNISLHLPYGSKGPLHRSVLSLLKAAGLDAAIMNPLDRSLMEMACTDEPQSVPTAIKSERANVPKLSAMG